MSIFTVPGKDIIKVTDLDYINDTPDVNWKVHILRLDFQNPDDDKMQWVLEKFSYTNRFVVDLSNIKYYNLYLKRTNLKYYVINTNDRWKGLVSFYKRNNKVLLDTTKLNTHERSFVFDVCLSDILFNTEVVLVYRIDYENNSEIFDKWRGNCIIHDENYVI